jgi:ribosomal protein S18 acetylase RimI-like enzyme
VIHFRTFRNNDPPELLRTWNEVVSGRGGAALRNTTLLEFLVLSKPYFDPAGLHVAVVEGVLAGWALAGFGPNATGTGLDFTRGVICVLAVRPAYRRRGLGTELLRRCASYLRERGASEVFAGPMAPLNPFTFGIYGGTQSPGFLDSDRTIGPFLERHGYCVVDTQLVLQRHLDRPFNVIDGRFPALRRRFEVKPLPRRGTAGWYQECVRGPLEIEGFRLQEKDTGRAVGRALVWELDPFSLRWNEHGVGILHVEIEEDLRRQGLARLLLGNVLRCYHDQYFTLVETQVRQDDLPALSLFRGLGFQQIDAGHLYRLSN